MSHTPFPPQIAGPRRQRAGCVTLAVVVLAILFGAQFIASFVIDYQWWQEMGQIHTWWNTWLYGYGPLALATLLTFAVLWISHARALKHAGTGLALRPSYAKLSTLAILIGSWILAAATIDSWTVVKFFGGQSLAREASQWHDPVFQQPLGFYLFDLPFFSVLLSFVLTLVAVAAVLFWVAARFWELQKTVSDWSQIQHINIAHFDLGGFLDSGFVRLLASLFLIELSIRFFLGRYGMLLNEHGFMVGMDYVNLYIGLPLQWLLILGCLLGAVAMLLKRAKIAFALVLAAVLLRAVIPAAVGAIYVRPNEISLEKPFIERHIEATRSAYGINSRTTEIQVQAKPEAVIDVAKYQPLLDNVRLWDWKAFRETVSQIQPLRPYVYSDVDVDRYTIDGKLRQVMLAPRELDLNSLGDARARWINPHFIYTHGYGLVMAESNQMTPNGLPVLFVKDAPPVITVPDLKLERPELYFGEQTLDPVFVRTAQLEFNYPAGEHNAQTRYEGKGGFPISSLALRTAAAISRGDWNILLTGYLTPESRMLIHRRIVDRLAKLAGFVLWDSDPYLVVTAAGHLVWIVDGYMTSDAHPYSKSVDFEGMPPLNYIRNSVKATVDAYDGTVKLYVFEPSDPLIGAYRNLFPNLLLNASEMPADLRAHVRYPEIIFRAQAEIYRSFHMRDPETFYNKSDAWDIAKSTSGQNSQAEPQAPTYLVATVPGATNPEFLLMVPFTPRNRDNLIGLMMARCDGEHLGEKVVMLLSKQEFILGPMQVEARINQDQNISKDLTLWNQQGSQVLRGQMLVLPIEKSFLYIEPIYLQSSQAKMPQLKKVALALGNTLIYTDTYQQALQQLGGTTLPPPESASVAPSKERPQAVPSQDAKVEQIKQHMQRYREFSGQGKWSEAGRELEAIQELLGK